MLLVVIWAVLVTAQRPPELNQLWHKDLTFSDAAQGQGQRVGLAPARAPEAEAQDQGRVPEHDREEIVVPEIFGVG